MTESEFYLLLQRYLDGTCTPAEQAQVTQWYDQLQKADLRQLPSHSQRSVEEAIWQRLRLTPAVPQPALRGRRAARLWQKRQLRWAAGLGLFVLGLGGLLPYARHWQAASAPTAATSANGWTRHQNTTPQVQAFSLPDGSRVTLRPGSSLRYPDALAGARREVYLEGEAFFQVHKNPARPFLVFTNQVVTTVLGTSFDVKAYPGQAQALVAVREGKVSVQPRETAQLEATPTHPAKGGVLLLPNQQVVYSVASHRLKKELVNKPAVLVPQAFEFEERPVAEVLATLEKAYGVPIVYDKQKLAGCTVSITFYDEPLFEKLGLLCKSLGAYYTLADTQITIHSTGCEAHPAPPHS
ncbi:FecR family protein [Hymenobacter bucti]|uniref:FecR family protein n=1 Tax=Hymenobacter bucti TaxID=1844114 RepID=A0ABW4QRI8_9BACT